MAMKLHSDTVVPPGAFWWRCPATGVRVPTSGETSLYGCIALAKDHYRANGLPVPGGLREQIEDFNCQKAPPGFCAGDERIPERDGDAGTAVETVLQGVKTIAGWLKAGSVPDEVAARRAAVCLKCPKHGDTPCPKCRSGLVTRLRDVVAATLGGAERPWDAGLKACAVCGCALKLKVRVPLEVIEKHTPKGQMGRYWSNCWIRTEQAS